MNILICDDQQEESAALNSLLRNLDSKLNTTVFLSGADAVEHLQSGAVIDVCILDIVMPEMSGIEVAAAMRAGGYAGEIVFLSTSRDYGPEVVEQAALAYLIKPPTADSVMALLNKLERARKDADTGSILLKKPGVSKVMLYRNISYIEVLDHYVHFRTIDGGTEKIYATFNEIADELQKDPRFIRCHRSFVVNMADISEMTDSAIVMTSGESVPISRGYSDLKDEFYKWKFGGSANE